MAREFGEGDAAGFDGVEGAAYAEGVQADFADYAGFSYHGDGVGWVDDG